METRKPDGTAQYPNYHPDRPEMVYVFDISDEVEQCDINEDIMENETF